MIQKVNNSPSFKGYRIDKVSLLSQGFTTEAINYLKKSLKTQKKELNKYSKGFEFRISAESKQDLFVSAHPKGFIKPSPYTYDTNLAYDKSIVKYPNNKLSERFVEIFKSVSENTDKTRMSRFL